MALLGSCDFDLAEIEVGGAEIIRLTSIWWKVGSSAPRKWPKSAVPSFRGFGNFRDYVLEINYCVNNQLLYFKERTDGWNLQGVVPTPRGEP